MCDGSEGALQHQLTAQFPPTVFCKAAAAVAAEARDACAARSGGRKLLVAGSLPPLRERRGAVGVTLKVCTSAVCRRPTFFFHSLAAPSVRFRARIHSYEPLSPAEIDDARRQYAVIASALSPKCDVLICETMASAAEVRSFFLGRPCTRESGVMTHMVCCSWYSADMRGRPYPLSSRGAQRQLQRAKRGSRFGWPGHLRRVPAFSLRFRRESFPLSVPPRSYQPVFMETFAP